MCDANEINERRKRRMFRNGRYKRKRSVFLLYVQVSKQASKHQRRLLGSFTRAFIQGDRERMVLLTTQEALHDMDTRHA